MKRTGLQMLRNVAQRMNSPKKKRAAKPGVGFGGSPLTMAPSARMGGLRSPDLGGVGPHEMARTGVGANSDNPQVGDWPYNKFARKGKGKKRASKPKGKGKKYAHKGHSHSSRRAMKSC